MSEPAEFLFELPPADLRIAEQKFRERNPVWTGCKANLIEGYHFYFVQVTYHGTYIDAFAGPQEIDKHEMWSAKLVLESRPRWLRNFYLFDANAAQVKRLREMCAAQPPLDQAKKEPVRKIRVYHGDFNKRLFDMLDWASVAAVAGHKKGGNKIEIFYFFPEGWINRSYSGLANKNRAMNKWWGDSHWSELLTLSGAVRAKYVCDRFAKEFKYRHVYPFPIYEKPDQRRQGHVLYDSCLRPR